MQTPIFECGVVENSAAAAQNRRMLLHAGVFAINLIGGEGVGKTALIETTAQRLGAHVRVGAVVSNVAPLRDAQRLASSVAQVASIPTQCLTAVQLSSALGRLNLTDLDVLLVESTSSSLTGDADLGQAARVGVLSVSGGDDKAAQSPHVVRESDAVVLTKLDLLPYVSFDIELFRADVHGLNPSVVLLELSSLRAHSAEQEVDRWIEWIEDRWARSMDAACLRNMDSGASELYVG